MPSPPSVNRRPISRGIAAAMVLVLMLYLATVTVAVARPGSANIVARIFAPLHVFVGLHRGADSDLRKEDEVRIRSAFQRLSFFLLDAHRAAQRSQLPIRDARPSPTSTAHRSPAGRTLAMQDVLPVAPALPPTPAPSRSLRPTLVTYRNSLGYVDKRSSAYARFNAFVDKAVGGNPDYGFSASDAALMYSLDGTAKYCNLAVSTVEQQVSDAEGDISNGRAPEIAGDSYLYAGPMLDDVSMTYAVCADYAQAAQKQRWAHYAEQTVWNIWHPSSAKWGGKTIPWSGWSIDNPGNNYYYSFLQATMAWALAGNRSKWIDFLRNDKLPALAKYFARLPGGGSNEGTGYGTSHMVLFSDYLLWHDGAGQDLASMSTHANDSIRYWMHATVPTLDRFAPIGDQARVSIPEIYDYQRRLMLEARQLSNDPDNRAIATWWLTHVSLRQMTSGFNMRYDLLPVGTDARVPAELVYLAKGTGHLFARTGWDKHAMWVSFIAGPFNESHAHQEQGGFTLFADDWLAVTENIWTRSGIQQGTREHNVLRFERNGKVVEQDNGTTASMTMTPGSGGDFTATANLTPVYAGNAAVGSWKRSLDFSARTLTVTDSFRLGSASSATFQVNVPTKPSVSGNVISAGKLRIRVLSPANPTIQLIDWRQSGSSEYQSGWRVDISGGTTGYTVSLSDH